MNTLEEMHALALELAREAGNEAVARLEHEENDIQAKGSGADVVTRVDIACERRMIERIQAAYSDHRITGEEHGEIGDVAARYHWLLDPLDGTNNYVMGMPLFGNCVTVLEDGVPVVAVVRDSMRGISTSAIRGQGAWRDGQPLRMADPPDLSRVTLSWTQGYEVGPDDPLFRRGMEILQREAKRVMATWAPVIDWGLIAAGHVGAFVSWRNTLHDVVGGMLIVEEAGGESWMADDAYELVISGHPRVVAEVRALLGL